MNEPEWKEGEFFDPFCYLLPWPKKQFTDGVWYICNECDSWDEHGKHRVFKCRTTNPKRFHLCNSPKKLEAKKC